MTSERINVVYLASGYPTQDNPSHGVFNKRAANALSVYVNLTVIQYRIYKPGRKLCERFVEDGIQRMIICVPFVPYFEKKMYDFNNRIFYLFTLIYARSILQTANIVHSSDGILSVFAFKLKRKFNFKLLVQFIGGDLNQELSQFSKKKWITPWKDSLDAVTFNSIALESKYKLLFGEKNLSKTIYRGVDTSVFLPSYKGKNEIIFYFLGGLPPYTTYQHGRNTKGGYNLMKAWSKLDNEMQSVDFKLLFAGPDSDISIVKEWHSNLKNPHNVIIVGKLNPSDIVEFHRRGNVSLIPSLEEGLPNVAMEAAASGNCVIANPVGGIPEIIQDGLTGLLCKSNDAQGLYDQMKWVLENRNELKRIGNAAAFNMRQNFSSKNFGKNYFELYKFIIK